MAFIIRGCLETQTSSQQTLTEHLDSSPILLGSQSNTVWHSETHMGRKKEGDKNLLGLEVGEGKGALSRPVASAKDRSPERVS